MRNKLLAGLTAYLFLLSALLDAQGVVVRRRVVAAAGVSITAGPSAKSTAGGSATTRATGAINTAGMNKAVVYLVAYCAAPCSSTPSNTVTDSKSNIWTPGTAVNSGSGQMTSQMFYSDLDPGKVGASHTFTCGSPGGYISCIVVTASGVASGLSQQSTATSSTSNVATLQMGSLTPSTSGQWFVTGVTPSNYAAVTFSINAGFTIAQSQTTTSVETASLASRVVPDTTAQAPTWTTGITYYTVGNMMAFGHQ